MFSLVMALICCAPEGTRTPNLLIRSQMLYPLSYGRLVLGKHTHRLDRPRQQKTRRYQRVFLVAVSTRRAPEGIRTPNLLIRSQMLYPLSYGRIFSCLPAGTGDRRSAGEHRAEAPGFEPGRGGYPQPH